MKEKENKKEHNIGIDLLKMLAMLFVVCVHIYMQGGVLYAEQYGTVGYYLSSFVYTIVLSAVDCFVIVHGYCACKSKFRLSRLLERWLVVLFWSVIISCGVMFLDRNVRSVSEMISMFFPVLRGRYWFFNAFFVLFMFEPILNHVVATLNKKKYLLMLIAIGVIFCIIPVAALGNDVLKISGGAEFCWFFALYLIGGYLYKFKVLQKINYNNWLNLMIVIILAMLTVAYKGMIEHLTQTLLGKKLFGELLWTNTSPIILGEAIFLFLFFCRLRIKNNSFLAHMVNYISPLVFSIYLIHVHPLIFWHVTVVNAFAPIADLNPLITTISVMGIAGAVYSVCLILDLIRMGLFKKLRVDEICDKSGREIMKQISKVI